VGTGTPTPEHVRRQRRGQQLEPALLDAARDELVEVGHANLTMESAAARAHTGIAVLYRRWANKDELVLAAIAHYGHAHPIETPNTGTLRSDLLAVPTAFSNARATFLAVLAAAGFSGLLVDTGLTPAQAHDKLLGDQRIRSDQIIYQRAHDRGGSISTASHPPSWPCRSTWFATTCSSTSNHSDGNASTRSSTSCSCPSSRATRARRRRHAPPPASPHPGELSLPEANQPRVRPITRSDQTAR